MTHDITHETPGVIAISGKLYMTNGEGHLVPAELVKSENRLEDQLVRTIISHARDLSDTIGRFKGHTTDDIATFQQLLEEKYEAPRRGGRKGNATFFSFDGLQKVEVRLADNLVFGPELQVAKSLIDDCIREWAADASDKIRALIDQAFQVDTAGRINRNAVLGLRTLEIVDERWQKAMEAITASIRIIGAKTYFRFFERQSLDAPWESIVIDLAAAEAPRQAEAA